MATTVYHFADPERAERILARGPTSEDDLFPFYRLPRDYECEQVGVEPVSPDVLEQIKRRSVGLPVFDKGKPTNVVQLLRPFPLVGDPNGGLLLCDRDFNILDIDDGRIMTRLKVTLPKIGRAS